MSRLVVTIPPPEEGAKRSEHGICSDIACVLYPLQDIGQNQHQSGMPSVCRKCGAYQVLIQTALLCPICTNIRLEQDIISMDYEDRTLLMGGMQGLHEFRKIVIAIDTTLLHPLGEFENNQALMDVIFELIATIPDRLLVSVVLFDNLLRAVRMNADFHPLLIDVLPRSRVLKSFSSEVYSLPAGVLRAHREQFCQILSSGQLTSQRALTAQQYDILEDLLDFGRFLQPSCNCRMRMVVLTSKGLSGRPGQPSPDLMAMSKASGTQHEALGYLYLAANISLDVVYLGHRQADFMGLSQVCSASTGRLLAAETIAEQPYRETLAADLKAFCLSNGPVVLDHALASLEVRSEGIDVDRLTGHLLPDSLLFAMHSMGNKRSNMLYRPIKSIAELSLDHVGEVLDQSQVTVCGLQLPADWTQSMVTCQLRPPAAKSTWWRAQSKPTAATAQVVLRVEYLAGTLQQDGNSLTRQERVRLTRVWTISLPAVPMTIAYPSPAMAAALLPFDSTLWGFVVLRGMLADFHVATVPLQPDDQHALRGQYQQSLDNLVQTILIAWPSAGESVRMGLLRMIYHLREGALLNGPSINAMESFLLRTVALYGEMTMALRIFVPAVTLDISHIPVERRAMRVDSDHALLWCRGQGYEEADFIAMPSETSSLLPGSTALLDLGNALLVYKVQTNQPMLPGWEEDSSRLLDKAKQLAAQRLPRPAVIQLYSDRHDTYRRLVYSQLSPDHMAPTDLLMQAVTVASPVMMTQQLIEQMAHALPYTDSLYFAKYVISVAPSLRQSYSKSRPAPAPTAVKPMTMDRGTVRTPVLTPVASQGPAAAEDAVHSADMAV